MNRVNKEQLQNKSPLPNSAFWRWAQAHSIWFYLAQGGCCAGEVLQTVGCCYDLERFGCKQTFDPSAADLLIVEGIVTLKSSPYLAKIYQEIRHPKMVMAIGSCACTGSAFAGENNYSVVEGAPLVVPVDVFVAGCPPRPEAIMNGVIELRKKIYDQRPIA